MKVVLTKDEIELLVSALKWQIQDLSHYHVYLLEQEAWAEADFVVRKIVKLQTLLDYIKSV